VPHPLAVAGPISPSQWAGIKLGRFGELSHARAIVGCLVPLCVCGPCEPAIRSARVVLVPTRLGTIRVNGVLAEMQVQAAVTDPRDLAFASDVRASIASFFARPPSDSTQRIWRVVAEDGEIMLGLCISADLGEPGAAAIKAEREAAAGGR